jgi:hypothetical protein
LRAGPERVYRRALRQFSVEEISEGFAAARGLALPSQLRRALREQQRGLYGRFLRLLPARPRPIRIQRWSPRRIGLLLLMLPVAALSIFGFRWLLVSDSQTTTHLLITSLNCSQQEPLWLQAQAVPSASLIPCVRTSPGWSVADATARNGRSGFTLDHDRAGRSAMVVRLTPTCDPAGATEAPSERPGVRHYERTERLPGRFTATWYDRFAGGCVTSELQSAIDVEGKFTSEASSVLGFTTRQALRQALEERSDGRLHLDPAAAR